MGILWKDSELNDTIVEAELRTLHVPPTLPAQQALTKFQDSKNRLLILVRNVYCSDSTWHTSWIIVSSCCSWCCKPCPFLHIPNQGTYSIWCSKELWWLLSNPFSPSTMFLMRCWSIRVFGSPFLNLSPAHFFLPCSKTSCVLQLLKCVAETSCQ